MGDIPAFHELIKKGDLDGVRAAVTAEPSLLNATSETGQGGYLLARYYRQPQIAEYLLSLNPDFDVFNNCVAGRTDQALDQIDGDGSLLESRNSDGWTPLHLAAFFGHGELAKALLNRGASLEAVSTNHMANTPLHAAAAGGDPELVSLLLDRGANVNARQHGGWSALHAAAQSGNTAMISVLLTHGADITLRAENNQSALDLALMGGKGDVAQLLEEYGAQLP